MSILTKAWNSILDETFTNCFKKSRISEKSVEKALNDEDDPFASLNVGCDGEFERWSWNNIGKIPWKLWIMVWRLKN